MCVLTEDNKKSNSHQLPLLSRIQIDCCRAAQLTGFVSVFFTLHDLFLKELKGFFLCEVKQVIISNLLSVKLSFPSLSICSHNSYLASAVLWHNDKPLGLSSAWDFPISTVSQFLQQRKTVIWIHSKMVTKIMSNYVAHTEKCVRFSCWI